MKLWVPFGCPNQGCKIHCHSQKPKGFEKIEAIRRPCLEGQNSVACRLVVKRSKALRLKKIGIRTHFTHQSQEFLIGKQLQPEGFAPDRDCFTARLDASVLRR